MGPVVTILGFHNVGEPPPEGWDSWFYIPEATFVEQLEWLRANHWTVIDIDTLLSGFGVPQKLPGRAALLTFDDGCRQFLDGAFPCLRRFEFPAVYFVSTGFIGGFNSFDWDVMPREPMFDWRDLRELERGRVSVQSHSVLHRRFSELTVRQRQWELRRSKAVLEQKLGKRIRAFAYPSGDYGGDRRVIAECLHEAGYEAACLYSKHAGRPARLSAANRYFLSRIPMGPDTDLSRTLNR
jgi:peptidoglycan/xylan/chitin deacetylase (PgdA/CDA1 family)